MPSNLRILMSKNLELEVPVLIEPETETRTLGPILSCAEVEAFMTVEFNCYGGCEPMHNHPGDDPEADITEIRMDGFAIHSDKSDNIRFLMTKDNIEEIREWATKHIEDNWTKGRCLIDKAFERASNEDFTGLYEN